MRIVMEKVSGMGGTGFAGKGGGELSTLTGHWTRSYIGECPEVGDHIAFGDEIPSKITQVTIQPAVTVENYRKPPTIIEPKTAWCICRESAASRQIVHRPEKWVDGLDGEEVA